MKFQLEWKFSYFVSMFGVVHPENVILVNRHQNVCCLTILNNIYGILVAVARLLKLKSVFFEIKEHYSTLFGRDDPVSVNNSGLHHVMALVNWLSCLHAWADAEDGIFLAELEPFEIFRIEELESFFCSFCQNCRFFRVFVIDLQYINLQNVNTLSCWHQNPVIRNYKKLPLFALINIIDGIDGQDVGNLSRNVLMVEKALWNLTKLAHVGLCQHNFILVCRLKNVMFVAGSMEKVVVSQSIIFLSLVTKD